MVLARRLAVAGAWLPRSPLASLIFWAVKVPLQCRRPDHDHLSLRDFRRWDFSLDGGPGASHRVPESVQPWALVLFELANVTNYQLPNHYVPAENPYLHRLAEHGDLAAYIRNRGEPARVEYDRNEIPYNIGDWYGLEAVNAYGASVLDSIWQMDAYSPRMQDFFDVKYYLGKVSRRPGLKEVFYGKKRLKKVFENITTPIRVFGACIRASSSPSPSLLGLTMQDAGFDPLRTVLLTGVVAPELGTCRPRVEEDVQMPLHNPNFVCLSPRISNAAAW